MVVAVNEARDNGGTLQVNGVFGGLYRQNLAEYAILHLEGALVEMEIAAINLRVLVKHNYFAPFSQYFLSGGVQVRSGILSDPAFPPPLWKRWHSSGPT